MYRLTVLSGMPLVLATAKPGSQFVSSVNTRDVIDVPEMGLDGANFDVQFVGDFLVAQALHKKLRD